MKFATVAINQAKGHILAHSVALERGALKKGTTLGAGDLEKLQQAGQAHVTVAMLEPDDVAENAAAQTLAHGFLADGVKATTAFAGRVNLIAAHDGVIALNIPAIEAFNRVDEAITIATLPAFAKVRQGSLLATIKIIPYGLPKAQIDTAVQMLGDKPLQLHGFVPKSCDIILTCTSGFKPSLLAKAEKAIRARIAPLNLTIANCHTVQHSAQAGRRRYCLRKVIWC